MKYPNSLVARVLKTKYYPSSSFWDASCGNNSSLTLQSICWAKAIRENGCKGQIENGQSIRIWHDKWLPSHPYFKHAPLISSNNVPLLVSDIIDFSSHQWHRYMLKHFFIPEDMAIIQRISLRWFDVEDMLV